MIIGPIIRIQVTEDKDGIVTRLEAGSDVDDYWSHKHFGLVIADIVRHVAKCFNAEENAVWKWVDKERYHKTTDITEVS